MPAAKTFDTENSHLTSPPENGFNFTPSDSTDLTAETRAISVENAGILRVTLLGMATGSYVDLPVVAGMNPMRAKRVWSAGTTVTGTFAGIY